MNVESVLGFRTAWVRHDARLVRFIRRANCLVRSTTRCSVNRNRPPVQFGKAALATSARVPESPQTDRSTVWNADVRGARMTCEGGLGSRIQVVYCDSSHLIRGANKRFEWNVDFWHGL